MFAATNYHTHTHTYTHTHTQTQTHTNTHSHAHTLTHTHIHTYTHTHTHLVYACTHRAYLIIRLWYAMNTLRRTTLMLHVRKLFPATVPVFSPTHETCRPLEAFDAGMYTVYT